MTAPEEFTRQQAADPATPQQVLADIAALRPDLRPAVALNPSAYPGLLEWLGSLGEPGVDSALGQRRERETSAAAAGGPGPTPPWVAPESVPAGAEGTVPAASAPMPGTAGPAPMPVPTGGPFAGGPGPQGPAAPGGFAGGYPGAGGPGLPPGGYGAGQPGFAGGRPGYPAPPAPKGSGSRKVLWIVLGVLGALLVVGVVVVVLVVNLARGVVEDLEEQGFDLGPLQEGQTYGDNPELDALWDACAGGDMDACDELYFTSEGGSEYEEFGDTCGGLTDGGSLCAQDDAGSSGGAETYGDDPELDALWDACAGGDMGACDELYFSAGIGTEYEEFGETCGRTQEGFGLCAP